MSSQSSALELLALGDAGRERSWMTKNWVPLVSVPFGILTGITLNFTARKPVMSGIHQHILATGAWTGVISWLDCYRRDYFAEKDAVIMHYVELHPDDFKVPERKKIADIIEEWTPVR